MRILLLILWVLTIPASAAGSGLLGDKVDNWQTLATQAKSNHLPIMLVVDSPDCGYCELLKSEILAPMLRQGTLPTQVLVAEMDLNTGGKITDFDGERIRSRLFLGRYQVFATPTVLFLDHAGRPLQDPLVGYNGAESYRPLLLQALQHSQAALEQITGRASSKMAHKTATH